MQNSDKQVAATATVGASTSAAPAAVKYLPLGGVSWGTMREEDLIPRFLHALETVDAGRAADLRDEFEEINETTDVERRDEWRRDLLDTLYDALNAHCPPYCYFGAHPGDGADYGVWISHESINEDVSGEELTAIDIDEECPTFDACGTDYIVRGGLNGGDFSALIDARTGQAVWTV